MHDIGQNIKSRKRPSVRPASVDKIVTLFVDRSSLNLEHSFPVSYRKKYFYAELLADFSYTHFTVSYRDALDRLRVQLNIILFHHNSQVKIQLNPQKIATKGHSTDSGRF